MVSPKINITDLVINLCESRRLPDPLIRAGMRRLLKQRLREIQTAAEANPDAYLQSFLEKLRESHIAEHTDDANDQHYEVPNDFFFESLGKRLKYSSCLYPKAETTLDEAEEYMLTLYGERAQLEDGMEILELGCGWGSLTIWLLQNYPSLRVTAVSNSHSQRDYINQRADLLCVSDRLNVITCDINQLELEKQFDRVMSVEMFEHVRNYDALLGRIAPWLKEDGKMFIHIFTHREIPYLFEDRGSSDWMSRHFFTGGTMPSHDLLQQFDEHFQLENDWRVNGKHYARTLEDWLVKTDENEQAILRIFGLYYGAEDAKIWLQRWRMFYMACAELFAFNNGEEWGVSHYLFSKGESE